MCRGGQSASWQTDYGGTPRKKNCTGGLGEEEKFFSYGFLYVNRRKARFYAVRMQCLAYYFCDFQVGMRVRS